MATTTVCVKCNEQFDKAFIVDLSCGCKQCVYCALEMTSKRTTEDGTICSKCNQLVTRHDVHRPRKRTRQELVSLVAKGVDHPQPKEKKRRRVDGGASIGQQTRLLIKNIYKNSPSREELLKQIGEKGMLVTESTIIRPSPKGKEFEGVPVAFAKTSLDPNEPLDSHEFSEVVKVFRHFNTVILGKKSSSFHTKADEVATPDELCDLIQLEGGSTLLFSCLFALATGCATMEIYEKFNNRKLIDTDVFPVELAAELLERTKRLSSAAVGPAVRLISSHHRHASASRFSVLLTKFRTTLSETAGIVGDARKFIRDVLAPVVTFSCRCLMMTIQDNINWKDGRYQIGQTLIAHRKPTAEQMQTETRLYNDANPLARLSRKRGVWRDKHPTTTAEQKESVLDKVFRPTRKDYAERRFLSLAHKKAAMQGYFEGLNSIDLFKKREREGSFHFERGYGKTERIFDAVDLPDVATDNQLLPSNEEDTVADGDFDYLANAWVENGIYASMPADLNFAKVETIEELMEYLKRGAENQVKEFAKMDTAAREQLEPPLSEDFVFFIGDGAPIKVGLGLLAKDPERWKKMVIFLGIFHAFMEGFKKAGKVHQDVLSYLVAPNYTSVDGKKPTEQNLSYFFNFNDPIIPERLVGTLVYAMNLKAIIEMKNNGQSNVSPISIHEYQRQCAMRNSSDAKLFAALEDLTDVFMFRKAERTDNADLYFSCMRLTLPLLAYTNSSWYVHIYSNLLQYWDTASDAEKEVIRKYGFTLRTPNGVTVGLDFGHEKYVRLVRDKTGKIKQRGAKARVESEAYCRMSRLQREGIKQRKLQIQQHDYDPRTGKKKFFREHDTEFLTKVMVLLEQMGAWGELNNQRQQEVSLPPDALPAVWPIFGAQVNAESLCMDSVGSKARDDYLIANNLANNTLPVERVTKGILKVRHFTATALKEAKIRVSRAAVTTNKGALDENASAAEIKEYLADLRVFNVTVPQCVIESDDKRELISALLPLRGELFKSNNEAKQKLEETAIGRLYGKTTAETRTAEFSRLRYSVATIDCPEPGHKGITGFRMEL